MCCNFLPLDTISSSFSKRLALPNKKVSFLNMTILSMLINLMKPPHQPMIVFTRPPRTVTFLKKSTPCFKDLLTKENPNRKLSKYYVCWKYQKLALKIVSGFNSYGLKISGQLLLIFLNGIMIWM